MQFTKRYGIITKLSSRRPVGQAAKTLASHAGNMGSIPVRVTKKREQDKSPVLFFCCRVVHRHGVCVGKRMGSRIRRKPRGAGSQEARRIPPRTRSVSRIPVEKENRTKDLFSFFAAVSFIDTAFASANAWVRESDESRG